jgi:hypothetical protein
MKMVQLGLMIFLSVFCGCLTNHSTIGTMNAAEKSPEAAENSMKVSNSIKALTIGKVEVSRTGNITVELANSSKEPLKVWKDSNSWGAACWRVLLIRKGHLETFFQNPDQGFTVNWPDFIEIAGSGHIVQKLDLNGGNWCGLGRCSIYNERGFGGEKVSFESNDMLIIVYDVPSTQEARDKGVWYGVIAATATIQ